MNQRLRNGKRSLLTQMLLLAILFHSNEGENALKVGNNSGSALNPPAGSEERSVRVTTF